MLFDRLVSGVRCQVSEPSLAAGAACLIEKNYVPAESSHEAREMLLLKPDT